MPVKLPKRQDIEIIGKMISELENYDDPKQKRKSRKSKRESYKKESKKEGVNTTSRSRSTDERGAVSNRNEVDYLKILIQTKDEQISKLVHKVSDLHKCNDEFSEENQRLQTEVLALRDNLEALSKSLEEVEKKECKECPELKKEHQELQADKENVSKCNSRLKDDIEMMKTLVYRLNVQIERYQEIVRKMGLGSEDPFMRRMDEIPLEVGVTNVHWGTMNKYALAPLLNAYEELLKEKTDLIAQHEREMNRFTGDFKELIAENEKLHEEMDTVRRGRDGWTEEKVRLQTQVAVCRKKADVQTQRADLANEKLVEVLRCYEQKLQSQSLDLERLSESYSRAKGELITLRSAQRNPEAIVESLKECQKLFEELKTQHDKDRLKLATELDETKKLNTELEDKLIKLRGEITTLNGVVARQKHTMDGMKRKGVALKHNVHRLKESREALKSRLANATHWAERLEASKEKVKNTWQNLRELESLVKRKDTQLKTMQAMHEEEVEKLRRRLQQREETIKSILKDRARAN